LDVTTALPDRLIDEGFHKRDQRLPANDRKPGHRELPPGYDQQIDRPSAILSHYRGIPLTCNIGPRAHNSGFEGMKPFLEKRAPNFTGE
jgi:hypothetical protein